MVLGLARLPMAEAVALSFFIPLIALYLAAIARRTDRPDRASIASLFGLAGVARVAGRTGREPSGERHIDGVITAIAVGRPLRVEP
jgi:S-adenosylmethionine uptake transporter